MRRGPYCTSGLVDIEKRTAQEEERAEDEVGQEDGDTLSVVALGVKQRAQRVGGDADDNDERGEGAKGVHIVGGAQLSPADESLTKTQLFDHGSRNGEPDERQPGDAGKVKEKGTQRGKRQPDE